MNHPETTSHICDKQACHKRITDSKQLSNDVPKLGQCKANIYLSNQCQRGSACDALFLEVKRNASYVADQLSLWLLDANSILVDATENRTVLQAIDILVLFENQMNYSNTRELSLDRSRSEHFKTYLFNVVRSTERMYLDKAFYSSYDFTNVDYLSGRHVSTRDEAGQRIHNRLKLGEDKRIVLKRGNDLFLLFIDLLAAKASEDVWRAKEKEIVNRFASIEAEFDNDPNMFVEFKLR